MNTTLRFTARASLVSLALISASAFAQEAPAVGPTRAEVVSETLAARANGTLVPAGQGSPRMSVPSAPSLLSRSSVESDVRSARAAGELQPAGDAAEFAVAQPATTSVYSRAEVKASVIAARRAGELVPAGEGPDASELALSRQTATWRAAREEARAERLAKR